MAIRIASFNLENLDDGENIQPSLPSRVQLMKPQLQRVSADIICFQEVHGQGTGGSRTLSALDTLLAGTPYANFNRATTLTTTGDIYDKRNIVTLSRFPISNVDIIRDSSGPRPRYQMSTAAPPDTTADALDWERPMLYTQITLAGNRTLHLINVHMKSKIASNIPGQKIDSYTWRTVSAWAEGYFISSMKRVGQSLQARLLIDDIFDNHGEDALIAMCGDFNAESHEVPVKTICGDVADTGNPQHAARRMVPCENHIPDSSRYTLLHHGQGEMIDHIIVSRPVMTFFSHAEIHNEVLPDESGAFRTDTKFPESDHAPVVAEFELN